MSDDFRPGPKFPGDLADRLPTTPDDRPDRWVDRVRHAWPVYAIAAVTLTVWLGALGIVVTDYQGFRIAAFRFVTIPASAVLAAVGFLMISGRNPETGEKYTRRGS